MTDIKQRLQQVPDFSALAPLIHQTVVELCQDALKHIQELEAGLLEMERFDRIGRRWECDCSAGKIAPLFNTDFEHVWCTYCGRGTRPKT